MAFCYDELKLERFVWQEHVHASFLNESSRQYRVVVTVAERAWRDLETLLEQRFVPRTRSNKSPSGD
jgi:hypothetical protein